MVYSKIYQMHNSLYNNNGDSKLINLSSKFILTEAFVNDDDDVFVDIDVGDNNDDDNIDNNDDDNNDDDNDDNDATTSIYSMQQGKRLNVDFNRHPKLKNYCMRLGELLNQNSEQLSQHGHHACNMLEWNIVDYGIFSRTIFPDKIPELLDISLPHLNLNNTLAALRRKDQRFDPLIKIMRSLLEKNKISDNSEWFGQLYKRPYQLYTLTKYHDIDVTTAMELWVKIFSAIFGLNYNTKLAPVWEFTHLILGQGDRGFSISDFAAVVVDQDERQYPFFLAEFASENTATHKDKIVVVSEAA
ncbi:hypothetical protein GLOIN_2v1543548 [Rhizophagus clarus]|uniref:Uncharacterized protein n=1 Tax=Rhizophagus clarus TaxID=94130 RepID=A0A8H3LGQ9_9GLOM|nr:hypothetical protein GLOIN_2v1543548 [Rhizophagus clarus]